MDHKNWVTLDVKLLFLMGGGQLLLKTVAKTVLKTRYKTAVLEAWSNLKSGMR